MKRVFICQYLPSELVGKYPTSQAQSAFCGKIFKTNSFDKVISLVQTNIKPFILSEINDDDVVYVQTRILPQFKIIRVFNNIIENIRIYREAKSTPCIWINNLNPQLLLSFYLLRYFSKSRIYSVVTDFTPPAKKFSISTLLEKALSKCDGIISLSSRSTLNFKNVGFLPGIVLNYKQYPLYANANLKKKVLFSGALSSVTGIELVLETISSMPDIQLIVSGRGSMEDIVRQYSSKYANIHYYGFLEKTDYEKVMNDVDVCLSLRNPDLRENRNNFPSKILEYLSQSKIVISTIEYPELTGLNYFVAPYSIIGLKTIINKVFSLTQEEIIEYTDHEKVLMEKFSISAWTKMFIQVEQEKSM